MAAPSTLGALVRDLRLPLMVAPMTGVSTVGLVEAAMQTGVMSSIPAHNLGDEALEDGLAALARRADAVGGRWSVNVIAHHTNPRRERELAAVLAHRPDLVVASVGSPAPVVETLAGSGILVAAAVATERHARRAVESGADALVLLTAGSGGQTGHRNPFSFAHAVRDLRVPFALAGGISDGRGLRAAIALGASLAVVGTRFIAAAESGAGDVHRRALVDAGMDDVVVHVPESGVAVSALAGSVPEPATERRASIGPVRFRHAALDAPTAVHTAGHGVAAIRGPYEPLASIVADLESEFRRGTPQCTLPHPHPFDEEP